MSRPPNWLFFKGIWWTGNNFPLLRVASPKFATLLYIPFLKFIPCITKSQTGNKPLGVVDTHADGPGRGARAGRVDGER